MADFWFGVKQ